MFMHQRGGLEDQLLLFSDAARDQEASVGWTGWTMSDGHLKPPADCSFWGLQKPRPDRDGLPGRTAEKPETEVPGVVGYSRGSVDRHLVGGVNPLEDWIKKNLLAMASNLQAMASNPNSDNHPK